MTISLLQAFALGRQPEMVAIVGGGGKTTLLFALARELPGQTIITTTTRIFAAQMRLATAVCSSDDLTPLTDLLARHHSCLVVGHVEAEKAFGVPADLPAALHARPDVDHVLIEADGSRMRPIKAPAAHEPVIPPQSTVVVPTMGLDALHGRIATIAHRPELLRALLPTPPADDLLTETAVAHILTHPQGGLQGVPPTARVIPLLNKAETPERLAAAHRIARLLLAEPRVERVVIGALQTAVPVRAVMTRVTAVVLAAGSASRMGQTKQLLPWGQTTVLGQTLANAGQTAVQNSLVVTGHDAAPVAAIAAAAHAATIHNPDYATGEMLSSLQTAVCHLPADCTAVLVLLADQPMVEPAILDQILAAAITHPHQIIAPTYLGQRGNPVLLPRHFWPTLLALPPGDAPRTLLRQHADAVHLLPVHSASVIQDLDDLTAYEQLRP